MRCGKRRRRVGVPRASRHRPRARSFLVRPTPRAAWPGPSGTLRSRTRRERSDAGGASRTRACLSIAAALFAGCLCVPALAQSKVLRYGDPQRQEERPRPRDRVGCRRDVGPRPLASRLAEPRHHVALDCPASGDRVVSMDRFSPSTAATLSRCWPATALRTWGWYPIARSLDVTGDDASRYRAVLKQVAVTRSLTARPRRTARPDALPWTEPEERPRP